MFSIPSFESWEFYILCTYSLFPLLRVERFTSFVHVLYSPFLELRVLHPLYMFSIPSFESWEFHIFCTCSLFPLLRAVSFTSFVHVLYSLFWEFHILCTCSLFPPLRVESFTSFVHVLYSFFWELRVLHPLYMFSIPSFESWEFHILCSPSGILEFYVFCYFLRAERMKVTFYLCPLWELSFMSFAIFWKLREWVSCS